MRFVYPEFLWGLLAIAIPIIIHLFNFRKYKKVYFSNVRYLKNVKEQTNKRSQLRQILILLARIFAITCLVLAFAKPFISQDNQVKDDAHDVSIYIDNSMSMEAVSTNGKLIDEAKKIAEDIAKQYKASDRFNIVTNDFEGVHQRMVTKEDFIQFVDLLHISPVTRPLNDVIDRQIDQLSKEDASLKSIYLISDFQKSTATISNPNDDSTISVQLVQLKAQNEGNFFMDSVWFEAPIRLKGKEENLFIRVVNNSDENADVHVELKINNAVKSFTNIVVNSKSSQVANMNYVEQNSGVKSCEVKISEYPNEEVIFDDTYYFSYNLNDFVPVLAIKGAGSNSDRYIQNIFEDDPSVKMETTNESAIDYNKLKTYGTIFLLELNKLSSGLRNELKKYVQSGGSVVLYPSENIDVDSYNEFLLSINAPRISGKKITEIGVDKLNVEHPLFKNMFEKVPDNMSLPMCKSYYTFITSSTSFSEKLMTLKNQDAFFSVSPSGKGKVYLSSVSLSINQSNIAKHSVFVALMLRIVEMSGFKYDLNYTFNQDYIELGTQQVNAENVKVKSARGEIEFIPEVLNQNGQTAIGIHDQIKNSGNFLIVSNDTLIGGFGLNYDRTESYFDCLNEEEITKMIPSSWNLASISGGVDNTGAVVKMDSTLWKWFIVLALLFLLIEIALIRLL